MNFSINMRQRLKGCTHRATEGLRWLSMSRYRCIERPRVSGSVGTLLCCDSGHSSKWISMEKVYLWFRLNSNMFNVLFTLLPPLSILKRILNGSSGQLVSLCAVDIYSSFKITNRVYV